MVYVVIGSVAATRLFPDFPRQPQDLDVFQDVPNQSGLDAFWDPKIGEYPWNFLQGHSPKDLKGPVYPTADELYTVKYSHIFWEKPSTRAWNKHLYDLVYFQNKGCTVVEPLYEMLYGIWEERYGKKQCDLTKEADEFFTDGVDREYDHDSIHYSVAYTPGFPLYETVMKDGASVQMDMKKVWALPKDMQTALFKEEVFATALERIMIPKKYQGSPGAAYFWALRRTITSLTKGKSARFIVDNIQEFIHPENYLDRHLINRHFLIPLEVK